MSRSSGQAPVSASGAADVQRPTGQPDLSSGTPTTSGRNSGDHLSGSSHRPIQRQHGSGSVASGRHSSSLGPASESAGNFSGGPPASLYRQASGQPHSSGSLRGAAPASHAPTPAAAAAAAGSGNLIAGRSPADFWAWVATFRDRQGHRLRDIIATQENKDPPVHEYYGLDHYLRAIQYKARAKYDLREQAGREMCWKIHGPGCNTCKTCHWCRQKTIEDKLLCGDCKSAWCGSCLANRHGENVDELWERYGWVCPICRDICNCSSAGCLRRRKGLEPTSLLTSEATHQGFDSVAEYLILTHLSANVEAAKMGASRQAGLKRSMGLHASLGRPLKQARIVTEREIQAQMQRELDEMSAEFGARALGRQPAWADSAALPVSMLNNDDDDGDGVLTGMDELSGEAGRFGAHDVPSAATGASLQHSAQQRPAPAPDNPQHRQQPLSGTSPPPLSLWQLNQQSRGVDCSQRAPAASFVPPLPPQAPPPLVTPLSPVETTESGREASRGVGWQPEHGDGDQQGWDGRHGGIPAAGGGAPGAPASNLYGSHQSAFTSAFQQPATQNRKRAPNPRTGPPWRRSPAPQGAHGSYPAASQWPGNADPSACAASSGASATTVPPLHAHAAANGRAAGAAGFRSSWDGERTSEQFATGPAHESPNAQISDPGDLIGSEQVTTPTVIQAQARALMNRTTREAGRGDRESLFLVQALDQQYTLLCNAADGSTQQAAAQRQCQHLFREWAGFLDRLTGPVALCGAEDVDPRATLADVDDLRSLIAFLELAADMQLDEAGITEHVLDYLIPHGVAGQKSFLDFEASDKHARSIWLSGMLDIIDGLIGRADASAALEVALQALLSRLHYLVGEHDALVRAVYSGSYAIQMPAIGPLVGTEGTQVYQTLVKADDHLLLTVLKQMAQWAAAPFTGITTLMECGTSAPATSLALRLFREDVAVSRAVREAALKVMTSAMLTATDELVPLFERGTLRGALAHQLKHGGGLAALQRLVALDYPLLLGLPLTGAPVNPATSQALKLPMHYQPANSDASVRAFALALGMLVQQGTHGWGYVYALACKPHGPARFWRTATRAEMKLHLLLLMQAIEGTGSALIVGNLRARVDLLRAWLRSLVEPSLRKLCAFGAKQLPVNRAFDALAWEGVSDITEAQLRQPDPEGRLRARLVATLYGGMAAGGTLMPSMRDIVGDLDKVLPWLEQGTAEHRHTQGVGQGTVLRVGGRALAARVPWATATAPVLLALLESCHHTLMSPSAQGPGSGTERPATLLMERIAGYMAHAAADLLSWQHSPLMSGSETAAGREDGLYPPKPPLGQNATLEAATARLQRSALRQLPALLRVMARVTSMAHSGAHRIQLDCDTHLLAALRQLLAGFLELPPAQAAESATEVALRRALVAALLPCNAAEDLEAMQKLLHLVVGICLRHYILGAAQSSSPAAQRYAVNAVRLASALLAEAANAGAGVGRSILRMVLPPLLKPMLVDIMAKARGAERVKVSILQLFTTFLASSGVRVQLQEQQLPPMAEGGVEAPRAELRGPLCHPVPIPCALFSAIMRPATQLLMSRAACCVQDATDTGSHTMEDVGPAEAAFTRVLGQPFASEAVRKVLEEPAPQAHLRSLPWFTAAEATGRAGMRECAAQAALQLLATVAAASPNGCQWVDDIMPGVVRALATSRMRPQLEMPEKCDVILNHVASNDATGRVRRIYLKLPSSEEHSQGSSVIPVEALARLSDYRRTALTSSLVERPQTALLGIGRVVTAHVGHVAAAAGCTLMFCYDVAARLEVLLEEHWPRGALTPDLHLSATHMTKLEPTAAEPVRLMCTALTVVHLQLRGQLAGACLPECVVAAEVGRSAEGSRSTALQADHLQPVQRGIGAALLGRVQSGRGVAQPGHPRSAAQGGVLLAEGGEAVHRQPPSQSGPQVLGSGPPRAGGDSGRGIPRRLASPEAWGTPMPQATLDSQATLLYGTHPTEWLPQLAGAAACQSQAHGTVQEAVIQPGAGTWTPARPSVTSVASVAGPECSRQGTTQTTQPPGGSSKMVWVDWRRAVRDTLRRRGITCSRKVEEIIWALWDSEMEVLDAVDLIVAQGL